MFRATLNALLACLVTFALCAVVYPASVYGLGHTLFPAQAEGSLIVLDGKVIGSELIAQPFASETYFCPRPSAAGANGFAADAASGSNLAPTNPALRDRIAVDAARQIARRTNDAELRAKLDRLDAIRAEIKARTTSEPTSGADADSLATLDKKSEMALALVLERSAKLGEDADLAVPVDLVTASGSGLDPHISPEGAFYQASRVARARGISLDRVRTLINDQIDRSGAILGAPPRVNVLLLNLALDRDFATK